MPAWVVISKRMSHMHNTLYLEGMQERFNEEKDGFARMALIRELRDNGFGNEAKSLIESWYFERQDYLDSVEVSDADVMQDQEEPPREFYYVDEEHGTPGEEGYWAGMVKKTVPMYLNVDYWTA